MNLHAVVLGAVSAVNPSYLGSVKPSAGYATAGTGKQVPAYGTPYDARMQVQPLSPRDLKQLDGLNVQGSERAVYISGVVAGVDRADVTGGSLLTFDSKVWLVTGIIEPWNSAGWTKVGVTGQTDTPA